MRNIKLVLEYDGGEFHGWQTQPGLRTLQQTLEDAIESLTRRRCAVTASGRTDAGVHALGQVVHFFTGSCLAPNVILKGINAGLPDDMRVVDARDVPQAFHATLDARSKRYRYTIDNRTFSRPLLRRYAWHVYRRLDSASMQQAAQSLLGRHDFRSFETEWPNRTSSVRTIYDARVERDDDLITIDVEADGFLYNMVRAIAGSLVYVGTGARPESWMAEVVAAEDRRAAGPNAPAHGLCLLAVHYDTP